MNRSTLGSTPISSNKMCNIIPPFSEHCSVPTVWNNGANRYHCPLYGCVANTLVKVIGIKWDYNDAEAVRKKNPVLDQMMRCSDYGLYEAAHPVMGGELALGKCSACAGKV